MVSVKEVAFEVGMNVKHVRALLRRRQPHKRWRPWKLTPKEAREAVRWLKARNGGGK